MGSPQTNLPSATPDDAELAGLRRGLGREGIPIPAYQTLGVEVRSATIGAAVVRVPVSPHLAAPGGGLLPGAFAVLADACCGCAVAAALPAGGAALTVQLRVEFIRPLPPGHAWIEGRAEADAVDDDSGLARAEIVDEADQLLGVSSLRIIKASHQGSRHGAAATPVSPGRSQPARHQADNPVARFLGVVSRLADSGRSTWTFRPSHAVANSFGMVHGGVLGLLAHEVASDALRSVIGLGEELIPLDLVVNFYRGVPAADGLAAAIARVAHRGRRFVVAEGEVAGPDGRPALRLSAGAQIRGTHAR
ncbi:MAG: hotdog fold thioesterase [Streptosporangiaceae bacterium]|nr:hotdog fold thioesterase [Streptosporangiaceae bacterium]MBV9855433.1 hotdog fold thioesterase [Streptosporangiaceae bacterium]